MAQKITFTFPTSTLGAGVSRWFQFTTDGTIVFDGGLVFPETPIYGTDPFTFDSLYPFNPGNFEVVKGSGVNNFANNFLLWLNTWLPKVPGLYFSTNIAGNVVELIWGSNLESNSFNFYLGDKITPHSGAWLIYTVEEYTIPTPVTTVNLPLKTVLSRSPYNFSLTPGVLFDEVTAEIFIYRGDRIIDKPLLSNYQVSKSVVQVGQSTINFDIHKLVNDFVKNKYNQVSTTTGAFTTSTLDSVWCYISASVNLDGEPQYQADQYLYAIDGFGYHTELANPQIPTLQHVLSNVTSQIIYNDSDCPLYFITEDLLSITVNGINVPFTFDQDISNQRMAYVNIKNYIGTSTSLTAVLTYYCGVGCEPIEDTYYFTIKDECKYPLINCIFKNKFGFWQTIPFNRLSKKTQDFTNESYNGIIGNYGIYSLNNHVKQTYNVNGREKVTVNTDFMPEEYNTLFTELMLSEFIYLEENGVVLPVNLVKTSFDKKTKLINKLIQYSMEFEYSFDLLNNIL